MYSESCESCCIRGNNTPYTQLISAYIDKHVRLKILISQDDISDLCVLCIGTFIIIINNKCAWKRCKVKRS